MTRAMPEQFELRSQRMGALPLLGYFLERMGLAEHLQSYLPRDDARLRLAPAAVIGLLVRSIVVAQRPLYGLAEWAATCEQALLGLEPGDEAALNDDRVGRTLDRLFDADRASLITACVLAVVREFGVSLVQLHNDSTTVTLSGSYAAADGRPRGGKATAAICHGHNKDFRPDLEAAALHPHRVG